MTKQAMSRAEICIIEGEQGSGKTNTAVAKAVDAYMRNVWCVRTLGENNYSGYEVTAYDKDLRVARVALDDTKDVTATIPINYLPISTTQIFANFHLHGIQYIYADLATIVEYLNTDFLTEGYVIIDESYIGMDARRGMSLLTQVMSWFGSQIRKRNLYLILIAQHGRMIESRFRLFMTEHILCSYNDKTHMITLTVVRRGQRRPKRTYSYDGKPYWRYFNTNELPEIPEGLLAKALMTAR